jgi:hypothetical protein
VTVSEPPEDAGSPPADIAGPTIVSRQKDEEQERDREHHQYGENDQDRRLDAVHERARTPRLALLTRFTADASSPTRASSAMRVGCGVFMLFLAVVLHLERQRGVPVWNSLWAEDGQVFLSDALHNVSGTLFAENGGYIHVVPRLIAGIVSTLPVHDAAAGMAIGATTAIALIAGFVYFASAEILSSRAARLALAAAVLLLPVPGSELLANVTNLHFYLLFGCFWALLWQSEQPAAVGARSAVALASALCDPLSALFLPLAIVAPLVQRTVRTLIVSGVFFAGIAVQLATMWGGARPERNWGFRLGAVPEIFSLRVAGGLLVGDRFLGDAWAALGRGFAYGALVLVAAIIAGLVFRRDRRTVAFVLISLGYAGLFFAVQMAGRGTGNLDPDVRGFQLNGARYISVPFLLMTAVILALVDRAPEHADGTAWRWRRRAGLVWIVTLLALNYSVTSDRSRGPRWDRELARARPACSHAGSRNVKVLVSPAPPRVWFATVPCGRF